MENKEKKKGKHPACSKAAENVCSLSFLSGGWLVVLGPESWAAFGQTGQLVREAALFQTLLLQVCPVPAQLCCPRRVACLRGFCSSSSCHCVLEDWAVHRISPKVQLK